jgi:hypothetical protein
MASKTLKSPSPDCRLPLLSSPPEIGSVARTICLPLTTTARKSSKLLDPGTP